MRRDWAEQTLLSEKARACAVEREVEASHSWAGLSMDQTQGPGVGSVEAAVPCGDYRQRRSLMWN